MAAASLAQALTPSLLPAVAMHLQPMAPRQQPHPRMPPTRCQALVSTQCCPAVGVRPLLIQLLHDHCPAASASLQQALHSVPWQHLLQAVMGTHSHASAHFSTPVGLSMSCLVYCY